MAGPGLWTDWLEDIDRRGLIEELLADGVIEEAAASAPRDHQLDRALNAKMTVICLIVGCQRLWVPRTSSTSRDQAIFVDQATDAGLFSCAVLLEIDRLG